MDVEYTLPNFSPSGVPRVKGQVWGAAYEVWSHVWTTSSLTEQKADEAELNNNLKALECAIFTEYSGLIILNI